SGNTGAATGPQIFSGGTVTANFSAIGSTTGITTLTGGNNLIGQNLKLSTLLTNNGGPVHTITFDAASPLLNAGSNVVPLATYARGFTRAVGQTDIGAVEMQSIVTNTNDSGNGSLRQAVLDANLFDGVNTITFDA